MLSRIFVPTTRKLTEGWKKVA